MSERRRRENIRGRRVEKRAIQSVKINLDKSCKRKHGLLKEIAIFFKAIQILKKKTRSVKINLDFFKLKTQFVKRNRDFFKAIPILKKKHDL